MIPVIDCAKIVDDFHHSIDKNCGLLADRKAEYRTQEWYDAKRLWKITAKVAADIWTDLEMCRDFPKLLKAEQFLEDSLRQS